MLSSNLLFLTSDIWDRDWQNVISSDRYMLKADVQTFWSPKVLNRLLSSGFKKVHLEPIFGEELLFFVSSVIMCWIRHPVFTLGSNLKIRKWGRGFFYLCQVAETQWGSILTHCNAMQCEKSCMLYERLGLLFIQLG